MSNSLFHSLAYVCTCVVLLRHSILCYRSDGYLFDKEAILEYIITKKNEYFRKLKEYEKQKRKEKVIILLQMLHFHMLCVWFDILFHVKWVLCHCSMARSQVVGGGDGIWIWKVAASISNKQLGTANKRWFLSLGVWSEANSSSP
jgi:hypothetical protein